MKTLRAAKTLSLTAILSAALAAGAFADAHGGSAVAKMETPEGESAGTVTLTEGPDGVLIEADLTGLEPGEHAIHIHETGACDPEFGEAGGHFNPTDSLHGLLVDSGPHAGDLPDLFAGQEGTAKASFYNTRITLGEDREGSDSLMDDDGAAFIVHAKADSYKEEAGAGGRVACGVIEPAS